jgi:hypothetical protein
MTKTLVNVDALMTMIVRADTHSRALELARLMSRAELMDLCDLLYVETPEQSPSLLTLALRVVIAGRGLDEDEARGLSGAVKRRVPMLVG